MAEYFRLFSRLIHCYLNAIQSHFGQLVSKIEFAEWFIVVPIIHSLAPLFIWNTGEQEAVKWDDLFLYFTFWSFF